MLILYFNPAAGLARHGDLAGRREAVTEARHHVDVREVEVAALRRKEEQLREKGKQLQEEKLLRAEFSQARIDGLPNMFWATVGDPFAAWPD